MPKPRKASWGVFVSVLILLSTCLSASAQPPYNGKILGGYFEEWSIYCRIQHCHPATEWCCR